MERDSFFDGSLLQLIGCELVCLLVTVLTVGICYPFAICFFKRWETKHTVIEGKRLAFDGRGMQLFTQWIKWWFFCLITLGIYSFWLPIKVKHWVTMHTFISDNEASEMPVVERPQLVNEKSAVEIIEEKDRQLVARIIFCAVAAVFFLFVVAIIGAIVSDASAKTMLVLLGGTLFFGLASWLIADSTGW